MKFNKGDFIVNNDPDSADYLVTGQVCLYVNIAMVQVELIDGTTRYWEADDCVLHSSMKKHPNGSVSNSAGINAAATIANQKYMKGSRGNPFVPGDRVQISNKHHKNYNDYGTVQTTDYPYSPKMSVGLDTGILIHVGQGDCIDAGKLAIHQTASAAVATINPAPVPPPLKNGDHVRYIGTRGITFKNGVVDKVYVNTNAPGWPVVADVFDDPFMLKEIPISELEVIPVATGSHYQAVVDPTSDVEKKPFDHDQLGTDLSGDELMKSIRDFCEGSVKW